MASLRGRSLHWAIWGIACCAVTSFGYNQGAAGNLTRLPSFYKQFPQINTVTTEGVQKQHNSTIQGTVVALYTLFGTFGAAGCIFLGDWLGRRKTIWIACLVQAIGTLLMGTSFQLAQFIVARIVVGLGTGGIVATVSVWQSELSKAESRGRHVSAFGIFAGIGLSLATWLEFALSFVPENQVSWRLPLSFSFILPVIVMSTIFTLPESPRWLVKVGRASEAQIILSRVHNTDVGAEVVLQDMRDIQSALEAGGKSKLSSMFKMGQQRIFHRLCLACLAQVFLQLTGTNAIVYYSTPIFQTEIHFSPHISYILTACLQAVIMVGAILCSYTVDRFGRRNLMIIGAVTSAICMAGTAGTVSNPHNLASLKAGVFFIFAFKLCYTLGWLGMAYLYASEIAPDGLRAAVTGVSTAVSWLFNFMIAEVTPIAFTNIGYRYFVVYAATNAAAATVVYFFFPETAGCTLEEIDEIFVNSKSIFDTVKTARTLAKHRKARTIEDMPEKNGPDSAKHIERAFTEKAEALRADTHEVDSLSSSE